MLTLIALIMLAASASAVEKPAGVCPKTSGFGLCAEMCNNCELKGMLCCSNGCGHQCMAPVTTQRIIEQGTCPQHRALTRGICLELCNNCEAKGQLCCSNGCGHECMDPAYKPPTNLDDERLQYECPVSTGLGPCVMACKSDTDCQGKGKCCATGCGGRLCTAGVLPNKSGQCPKSPPFGGCFSTCSSHFHCPGNKLCCAYGCAQECKDPVYN